MQYSLFYERVSNMDERAINKYQFHAVYHNLVCAMRQLIEEGTLTGDDIIEAAELACKMNKEQTRRISNWNETPF